MQKALYDTVIAVVEETRAMYQIEFMRCGTSLPR